METPVNHYELEDSKGLWPTIVERFNKNVSDNGVPYFKQQPSMEMDFVRFCNDNGLRFRRKTILEYSGRGPTDRPFYYLAVRDTREYEQEFIRLKCDGGGKGMCWSGAEQVRKVTLTAAIAKVIDQSDIVVKNYPISPRVYLISRRLKDLMEPFRFSGIAITPCLEVGAKYSEDEAAFASRSGRLEKEAKYFQLNLISRTPGKPSIGNLVAASGCPRCHALSIIDGDKESEFKPADLGAEDFQRFNEVTTENKGDQHMIGQIALISARALGFFIESRIKGLKPYSTDPPVKYAAVQIRG